MTKPDAHSRQPARIVAVRKSPTIEMVRLTCPDAAQALQIAETFGTADIDGQTIMEAHERLIIDTARALREALADRAMQIHLQRIVAAFVGSAYSAGQFYSKAVTEARDATAKSANDARDEDLDGPAGFNSLAQRKREFAADAGIQAHALRIAAEGAVAAYGQVVGQSWRPYDGLLVQPGPSIDRRIADMQLAAFE